tara:strand:+ start:562 stop:675 length:114 start_codon:yes stop_codon:yes gene_type:complete
MTIFLGVIFSMLVFICLGYELLYGEKHPAGKENKKDD